MRYEQLNTFFANAEPIPGERLAEVSERVGKGLGIGGSAKADRLVTLISTALIRNSDILRIDIPFVARGENQLMTSSGESVSYRAAADVLPDGSGVMIFSPRYIESHVDGNFRYDHYYENPQQVVAHEMYHIWQAPKFPRVIKRDVSALNESSDNWEKARGEKAAQAFAHELVVCGRYYNQEFRKKIGPFFASRIREPRAIQDKVAEAAA